MRELKGGGSVTVGRVDSRFLGRKKGDEMAECGRGKRVSKWGDGREKWASGVMGAKSGQVGEGWKEVDGGKKEQKNIGAKGD